MKCPTCQSSDTLTQLSRTYTEKDTIQSNWKCTHCSTQFKTIHVLDQITDDLDNPIIPLATIISNPNIRFRYYECPYCKWKKILRTEDFALVTCDKCNKSFKLRPEPII